MTLTCFILLITTLGCDLTLDWIANGCNSTDEDPQIEMFGPLSVKLIHCAT